MTIKNVKSDHTKTERIIEKIQKLMAKAESAKEIGNIEEASAFSAKVNEMLTVHNLAMADLDTDDEDEVTGERTEDLDLSRQFGRWTINLLTVLTEFNFCHAVYHSSTKGFRMNRRGSVVRVKDPIYTVTLVGQPENLEVVKYLYSVLKRQFEQMASQGWKQYLKETRQELISKHGETKSSAAYKKPWKFYSGIATRSKWLTSFYLGAVTGVHQKLREKQREAESVHGSKITDLVLAKDAAVQDWVKENFPNLGKMQQRKRTIAASAYNQGQQAGRSASMAKGVSTGDSVATKYLN